MNTESNQAPVEELLLAPATTYHQREEPATTEEEKRAKWRVASRKYYQRNRDRLRFCAKLYHAKNRDRILERKRDRRAEERKFRNFATQMLVTSAIANISNTQNISRP